jgi:methyl-accepting chemotaxis protein
LQRQISALGADSVLKLAVVVDDHLQVLVSSQFEFSGKSLEATPLSYAREQIARSSGSRTDTSANRQSILGVFPFSLPPAKGEWISSREGFLIMEYDLAHPKRQIVKTVTERSLYSAAALTIVSLLVWAFFHRVLNRRITTLMAATKRIASGEEADSVRLQGSDELARLSESFDLMAQRIGASTRELRDANERMKQEINERKFIEEALRNSERRFRSIWENSLEACV